MVAKRVEVLSKKYGDEKAYLWSSEVSDGYAIEEASKATNGTIITHYLKENEEEENNDEFLSQYELHR